MESIVAVSTPPGTGGIAVVRLSGDDAFEIAAKIWHGTSLADSHTHTTHLGEIIDLEGNMIDQALATVFHEGRSFTGENTVELSLHGSPWLQREVVNLLIKAGASAATPGEFTRRAFLNGRIDLTQAEGVADIIAASSKAAATLASRQLKGSFSDKFNTLRENLIELASLMELELDFSEEEVEFADRSRLLRICAETLNEIHTLTKSFRTGKALRDGVAVVIAGIPNAGKSTLLNALIGEEKAIVSDIPGTTRDIIEDTAEINGILFRFYDTAGLRADHETSDTIERIGIERAKERIAKADILMRIFDSTQPYAPQLEELEAIREIISPETTVIDILNKTDLLPCISTFPIMPEGGNIPMQNAQSAPAATSGEGNNDLTPRYLNAPMVISAKKGEGISDLEKVLTEIATKGRNIAQETLLTNARHYESLLKAGESLKRVQEGLKASLPTDLTTQDLREAIHHLSSITGSITSDTLLQTIFSRFCIGK